MSDLFHPKATTKVSATTSASAAARFPGNPQGRFQVRVTHDGSAPICIAWGGSSVAATTSDMAFPGSSIGGFTVNNAGTDEPVFFSVITTSGTANVWITTGSGI